MIPKSFRIEFLARRRAFITLVARAQQGVRRIGIMMNLAADDSEGQARLAAFLQGLQETGWVVGRNAQIDIRWGMGDPERIRKNVTELVALRPDAMFATTFPTVVALQQATRTVPIVFAGLFDPVLTLARRIHRINGLISIEQLSSAKLPRTRHSTAVMSRAAIGRALREDGLPGLSSRFI